MSSSSGSRAGRFVLRWAIILAVLYLVVLGALAIFEEKLIFIPMSASRDWTEPGDGVVDAWFEADDGTKLHGWYLEHDQPRAVVLFAHGNAGNLSHRREVIHRLGKQLGVSVLAFDYRGYGKSEGKPNEEGVLADARAARRWLADRASIEEQEIVLLGRSLGGAVVVDLAAADGARGLILENTFTSLPDVAAKFYPWLPVRWLMRTRLDSASKIADYDGPLLQSHAGEDSIIPVELGRKLFDAANEPKTWITFDDMDHNDPHPIEYDRALDAFFEQLP
ncbi:MAG: alpha/beta hydrolase [Pirellulales bacterium]|nr:alpha/beta hydrolase [Pirellulales bacterium]